MSNPFDDLMKQSQALQEKIGLSNQDLEKQIFTGEAGAGMVKVSVNGKKETVNISLEDTLLSEDKKVIEDLLVTAVNNAYTKAEENSMKSIADIASTLNLKDIFNNLKQ